MDDLEFRRAIYADPQRNDDEIMKAASNNSSRQRIWQEIKQLDSNLQAAAKVKVPDDLAHKLILRQTLERSGKQKRRHYLQLAMAASVAFVLGLTVSLWKPAATPEFSQQVLAHVHHALKADEGVNLQQVNAKLASFGGTLTDDIGKVYYANFCDLALSRSLHLVIEGTKGKVTVFILPQDNHPQLRHFFNDERFIGESVRLQKADMMIVAEKGEDIDTLAQKLKARMQFKA